MSNTNTSNNASRFSYFNRELSWLTFNRRVLEQAQSPDYPLLERMKFLAFVSSNLDEFFEIRVAGLLQQVKSGANERGPDGLGAKEQLRRVQLMVKRLVSDQYDCWKQQIVPGLEKSEILFCGYDELTRSEKKWVKQYFEEQVFPVLTPLAIDPAHPFPQLSNKALYILASIDDPKTRTIERRWQSSRSPECSRVLYKSVSIDEEKPASTFLWMTSCSASSSAYFLAIK